MFGTEQMLLERAGLDRLEDHPRNRK